MHNVERVGWGVIGTGSIARSFTRDLHLLADQHVVALGSRDSGRAEQAAAELGVERSHGSYEALVADPAVDVVYVATPHPFHLENALLAIGSGKPVLVEKPFTVNSRQAQQLVTAAHDARVFAMEAMWTRFLPHIRRVKQIVDSGDLGRVTTVIADHGQRFLPPDPTSRLYAPALAGGALLDLGVYPVSFASHLLGPPATVTAVGDLTSTGVDAQTSMLLRYDGGRHALLTATLGARTPTTATVSGSEGRIEIAGSFYRPTTFRVVSPTNGTTEVWDRPEPGHGLRYQAVEVLRCLRAGLTESPLMPHRETISVMATMDEVRRQVGLSYPGER